MSTTPIAKGYELKIPTYDLNIKIDTTTHIRLKGTFCFSLLEIIIDDIVERTDLTINEVLEDATSILVRCIGNTMVQIGTDVDIQYVINYVKMLFLTEISLHSMETHFISDIFDYDSPLDKIIENVWNSSVKSIYDTLGTDKIEDITALLSPEYYVDCYILNGMIADSWVSVITLKDENE